METGNDNENILIGLRACESLIKTALHIPFLADESPVGIMIISKPGMGKSMFLSKFNCTNTVVINDMTGYGLEQCLMEAQHLTSGYFLVPDILRLMARSKGWESFLTLTNIILEEGLTSVRRADIRIKLNKPIRFGIITAITEDMFRSNRDLFEKIGFTSRFGLFSFNYERSDYERIENLVAIKNCYQNGQTYIKSPSSKTECTIDISPKMQVMIKKLGRLLATGKRQDVPFRSIAFVRRLVKANALMEKRKSVTEDDIRAIYSLSPFFIPPYPKATDLEYFILKKITDAEIKKMGYTGNELEGAKQRITDKGINWKKLIDDELLEIDTPLFESEPVKLDINF